MDSDQFRIEPLGNRHDRADFSCGVPALDRYLQTQAGQDARRRLSTVMILRDIESDAVAGFYTLSSLQFEPSSLPPDWAKRLPRRVVPATLLGRLAVDVRFRRRGLGGRMLFHALTRALDASALVAAFAVVVDAKDDTARSFYEQYGFVRFADDPYRLLIPVDTIARLVADTASPH